MTRPKLRVHINHLVLPDSGAADPRLLAEATQRELARLLAAPTARPAQPAPAGGRSTDAVAVSLARAIHTANAKQRGPVDGGHRG